MGSLNEEQQLALCIEEPCGANALPLRVEKSIAWASDEDAHHLGCFPVEHWRTAIAASTVQIGCEESPGDQLHFATRGNLEWQSERVPHKYYLVTDGNRRFAPQYDRRPVLDGAIESHDGIISAILEHTIVPEAGPDHALNDLGATIRLEARGDCPIARAVDGKPEDDRNEWAPDFIDTVPRRSHQVRPDQKGRAAYGRFLCREGFIRTGSATEQLLRLERADRARRGAVEILTVRQQCDRLRRCPEPWI